jgi:hypothetical protein
MVAVYATLDGAANCAMCVLQRFKTTPIQAKNVHSVNEAFGKKKRVAKNVIQDTWTPAQGLATSVPLHGSLKTTI